MGVTNYHINQIEKALGFKLYAYQVNILKGIDDYIPGGRRTGRTLTHMLVELMNPSKVFEPINLIVRNKNDNWYKRELLELRADLVKRGIPCREVK